MNGLNGKTALGVILVIIGGMIVLRFFGFTLGPIFSYIFPIILLGLGYIGLKNGKNWIGMILIAVGAITLLAKLSGVIFLILAVAAILIGVSIIKGKGRRNVY